MTCAKHPKVETQLSCGRCGTPICPDCMVNGAVGLLCRACAVNRPAQMYAIRPERFALAVLAGLIAGTIVGVLLQALSGFIFFTLMFSPVIGGFLGEVILRATGRKRGLALEILAGASVVIGAAVSSFFVGTWQMYLHSPLAGVLFLVAVVLTAGAAVGKIRYW